MNDISRLCALVLLALPSLWSIDIDWKIANDGGDKAIVATEAGWAFTGTEQRSPTLTATIAAGRLTPGIWYLRCEARASGVEPGDGHWQAFKLTASQGKGDMSSAAAPMAGDGPGWVPLWLARQVDGGKPLTLAVRMEGCRGTWTVRNLSLEQQAPAGLMACPGDAPGGEARLDLGTGDGVPFTDALLGLNAHFFVDTTLGWGDPALDPLLDRLAPTVLRFPGGTVANWYDWRSDCLEAAWMDPAFQKKWIETLQVATARTPARFAAYAAECAARGVTSIQVFNINREDPAGAADRLRAAIAAGCRPRWIELGNESALVAQRGGAVRDADSYVAAGAAMASALKAVDPGILVAANADTVAWGQTIAKAPWADAVVVHPYLNLGREADGSAAGDEIGSRGSAAPWLLLATAERQLWTVLQRERERFAPRPLLVSEWGVMAPAAQQGSRVHALAEAVAFTALADHAADGGVAMASLHIFWGTFMGLYYSDRKGALMQRDYAGTFALLSRAFRGTRYLACSVSGRELYPGASAVVARGALRPDGSLAVVAVNRSAYPTSVRIMRDGAEVAKPWTMTALAPVEDPLAAHCLPAAANPFMVRHGGGDMVLPPLTLALLEWKP